MLLSIREMQIKTTVIYHYIHSKIAKIKNSYSTKFWREDVGSFARFFVGCKMIQPLWKSLVVTYKLNMCQLYDPEISLLGIYTIEMKTCSHKNL